MLSINECFLFCLIIHISGLLDNRNSKCIHLIQQLILKVHMAKSDEADVTKKMRFQNPFKTHFYDAHGVSGKK